MTVSDTTSQPPFPPELVKKLILKGSKDGKPSKRITHEAVQVSAELLRLFVQEARHRAGIEAECEKEGSIGTVDVNCGDDDNDDLHKDDGEKAVIRGDHITKVAAELLMDFA